MHLKVQHDCQSKMTHNAGQSYCENNVVQFIHAIREEKELIFGKYIHIMCCSVGGWLKVGESRSIRNANELKARQNLAR